ADFQKLFVPEIARFRPIPALSGSRRSSASSRSPELVRTRTTKGEHDGAHPHLSERRGADTEPRPHLDLRAHQAGGARDGEDRHAHAHPRRLGPQAGRKAGLAPMASRRINPNLIKRNRSYTAGELAVR